MDHLTPNLSASEVRANWHYMAYLARRYRWLRKLLLPTPAEESEERACIMGLRCAADRLRACR